MDWTTFSGLLSQFAKTTDIKKESVLFGTDLNIGSLAFLEFIMTFEEEVGVDIDVDDLEEGIKTVGQLFDRLTHTN